MKDHNARLKAMFESLSTQTEFAPGDLVRLKDGLQNKKRPKYGQTAIVTEVFSEPFLDQSDNGGSSYFREPLSVKLGFTNEDGDFVEYNMDGRRFEKVPESEL